MTRYAHSTGHHVPRRFGWDCHGLPIEFEIDKLHGVKVWGGGLWIGESIVDRGLDILDWDSINVSL